LLFTFGQHPDGGDPDLLAECMQVGTIGPDDVQRGSEKLIPGLGDRTTSARAHGCAAVMARFTCVAATRSLTWVLPPPGGLAGAREIADGGGDRGGAP
jgi:hypothetical protein